jgi:hypothetical protein
MIELYWYTNTLVSFGLLPKEEEFRHLKSRMEDLEIQKPYITNILSWMANWLGGTFTPPDRHYSSPKYSNAATQRNASNAAHQQGSQDH